MMKGLAVYGLQPVARIEGQKVNFCSFRELRRLVDDKATVDDMSLESHG